MKLSQKLYKNRQIFVYKLSSEHFLKLQKTLRHSTIQTILYGGQ